MKYSTKFFLPACHNSVSTVKHGPGDVINVAKSVDAIHESQKSFVDRVCKVRASILQRN